MNYKNINRETGLSLIGMILICVLLILAALLGIKVMPDYMEYRAILNTVKETAQDPASRTGSVADIRRNYDRRKLIDNITAVTGDDLDITKEGNDVVISFAYEKKIPLTGPVSLLIDFEGSSAQ